MMTPLFDAPMTVTLLYSVFMGLSVLGVYTIVKIALWTGAGNLLRIAPMGWVPWAIPTSLCLVLGYVMGWLQQWPLWMVALLLLLVSAVEGLGAGWRHKEALGWKKGMALAVGIHIPLLGVLWAMARWLEFLYATQYGFEVIMAFTIYVVAKLLGNMVFVVVGKYGSRIPLYLGGSMVLSLPLLWIGFEQNLQVGYMATILLYATLLDGLLVALWLRGKEGFQQVLLGTIGINILVTVLVLAIVLQRVTTTL